jgi:hypothetical protein
MRKVLIFDTSILCVYLQVPNMETAGSDHDKWDKKRVDQVIEEAEKANTTFVLPLASIIETGNHISQIKGKRYDIAQIFAELMRKAADVETPWAAFTEQAEFWESEGLKQLAEDWLKNVTEKLSLGDVSIKAIAEYYAKIGCRVEILTADAGLKAYEPSIAIAIPRRRQR